jgi:3-methylcrotonyl-CoA carboxylase beta subunit
MICGIGRVSGRECVIVANDATIKGGTYYPMTVKKHLRAQEVAAQNRLPCVYLVDSGGGYLPEQDNVFPDREHFGRIFFNIANMSAPASRRSPASWAPAPRAARTCPRCPDESIIVRGQGTIFLGGPPLVKAATGEVVTPEELGGAEVHTRVSGVADHYAPERRPRARARPAHRFEPELPKDGVPRRAGAARAAVRGRGDLRGHSVRYPQALRRARDHRPAGRRLRAGRVQAELWHHARHGLRPPARLPGGDPREQRHPLLRVLAQGDALHRARRAARHPALFLQNITGYMVGKKYEAGGIAKDGAKMVTAVATAEVPNSP